MRQGGLFDDIPELRFCQDTFVKSRKLAKSRLPRPVVGETQEDYQQELKDEVRLEFCVQLRQLADKIERTTLARQREAIDCLYKGIIYTKIGRE